MIRTLVSWLTRWPLTRWPWFQRGIRGLLRLADDGPVRSAAGPQLYYKGGMTEAAALRRLMVCGGYEPESVALMQRYATGIVVDVGAHEGLVALVLAQTARQVVAVEPNPENLALLNQNVALNPSLPVTVKPCAAGETDGPAPFYCSPDCGAWGASQNWRHSAYAQTLTIPQCSVDTLTKDLGKVSLLKIDTEGYELQVLRGATGLIQRDKPVIVFEVSLTFWAILPQSVDDLLDFVRQQGYTLHEWNGHGGLRPLPRWLHRRVDNLIALPK